MLNEEVAAWLEGQLPEGWFTGPPEVEADNEEILVVGPLPPGPGTAEELAQGFRESSREQRVRLAKELERRFRRRVAWGVRIGAERYTFTTHSTPVMTRLRLPERRVLDTLVEAGVARSRSDALAWCVRLVGRHEREWIEELRQALVKVGQVRKKDPSLR